MIDVGSGPAIVLIPGIQGRWEWMRPAVQALAVHWRVLARSLPGEPGEAPCAAEGFDQLVGHIDRLLDQANVSSAVICGVSFGGLVALRYAAMRPARVRALILVSTPGPKWKPAAHQARYLRWPILTLPLFMAGAARRVWRELRATLDLGVHHAGRGGRITDHEALVGRKLSWVLSGGALPAGARVSEEYLLDLEREAFLSLCGESKTLARIQHTLKTGKTLKN